MSSPNDESTVQELNDRLERYARILYHTGNFLAAYPYWNLNKTTLPLRERMDAAWNAITEEDRQYNTALLGENGERA